MPKPKRTDNLTAAQRRKTMKHVRGKDTTPELFVRRLVHGMGFRYRLHRRDLPGAPDMVFVKRKKIIFVHGCFWHGHNCKAGRKKPQTNRDYWQTKLNRNRTRDAGNQIKLKEAGWDVLVVWECETQKRSADRAALEKRLKRFLETPNKNATT